MIQKIVPSWLKAVDGNTLTDAFGSAWANIVNALEGAWGYLDYEIVQDNFARASVSRSEWVVRWETTLDGIRTISIPAVSIGYSTITVEIVSGNVVTQAAKYAVAEGDVTLSVNLPAGQKIVTLQGKARRL